MNNVETRLEEAAAEIRSMADRLPVPLTPATSARAKPGFLVLAAAFAAVVLVVGAIPFLMGEDDPSPLGMPSTVPPTSSTTVDTLAPCSLAGSAPAAAPGLNVAAAETLTAMAAAVSACDVEALAQLASPQFVASFGGGGPEVILTWTDEPGGRLDVLASLMSMSFEVVRPEDGPAIYVWPAAFAYETWDEIPQADLDELEAIYTPDELDGLAAFGSYAGWRIGIDEDGGWLFFVAGD